MPKKSSRKLITFSFLLQSSWKFIQSKFIGVHTKCRKLIFEFFSFSQILGVLKDHFLRFSKNLPFFAPCKFFCTYPLPGHPPGDITSFWLPWSSLYLYLTLPQCISLITLLLSTSPFFITHIIPLTPELPGDEVSLKQFERQMKQTRIFSPEMFTLLIFWTPGLPNGVHSNCPR